jgi:(p)ppGpp synthase/HD superfamily hydrolase
MALSLAERTECITRASALAIDLHQHQVRKGTTVPYVAHLFGVASLVLEDGGDGEETAAALLHDAVEDQGGQATLDRIRAEFGPRVATIVEGCSDSIPEPDQPKAPWRPRKEAYVVHLASIVDAAEHDPLASSVLRVGAADKLHNLRSMLADYSAHGEATWNRFNGRRDGTLWYYRTVLAIYRRGPPSRSVDLLARTLDELEQMLAS